MRTLVDRRGASAMQHVALRSIELDRLFAYSVYFSSVSRTSRSPQPSSRLCLRIVRSASTSRRDYDVDPRADVAHKRRFVVAETNITSPRDNEPPCSRDILLTAKKTAGLRDRTDTFGWLPADQSTWDCCSRSCGASSATKVNITIDE